MVAGRVIADATQLTNGATYDIRPDTSGVEWCVTNIHIPDGKTCNVKVTDGTYEIDRGTVMGPMDMYSFHVTRDFYIKVTNTSGETINVGFDGVYIT